MTQNAPHKVAKEVQILSANDKIRLYLYNCACYRKNEYALKRKGKIVPLYSRIINQNCINSFWNKFLIRKCNVNALFQCVFWICHVCPLLYNLVFPVFYWFVIMFTCHARVHWPGIARKSPWSSAFMVIKNCQFRVLPLVSVHFSSVYRLSICVITRVSPVSLFIKSYYL